MQKKINKNKLINFKFSFIKNHTPSILSLKKYKLYINHLKLINLFLNKKSVKNIKKSKKDQFKKIDDLTLRKKIFFKEVYFFKNYFNIKDKIKKKNILKKYIKKRIFTFFNLPFYNFTKKSIGTRMGKGKGSNFNYYIQITPGFNILFFFNWEKKILLYILKYIIKILPSYNKVINIF